MFKNRFTYNKSKDWSEARKKRIIVKDRNKNYRLDLQPQVQEILGVMLDPTIYRLKC
jgi:hypothetical protein